MTIVEFFDDEALDNALGAILMRPERVVILYAEKSCNTLVSALDKILKKRNIKTEIITRKVDISSVETACEGIESVAKEYPDCDFDIAGGNDIMLVATGSVAKKYSLPLHTVDVKNQSVRAVNGKGGYKVFKTRLTIPELISLYGGKCAPDAREEETYTWERNLATEKDIEAVWEICRRNPGAWNSAVGAGFNYRTEKRNVIAKTWYDLKQAGMAKKDGGIVRYKSPLVQYLLSKQGTALEMYTFISAKATECFDDGQSGVVIDWKGRREVENEIDVLLTQGAVGYFISCKNGMVESDELYKLRTVADRFGGRYAKKILVLSYFEPDMSFMQRADELGIKVIKNVRHLQKKDFMNRIVD
ncbi:MAG: DUF1887 family protein [Clostridia bacterium]|nr:DUF1887 family protein [Clostridia bacterium]